MKKLIEHLKDRLSGKVPSGHKRSDQWPKVRAEHLKLQPLCAMCGKGNKLNVHHKLPFHLDPSLELEPTNLITLCESKKGGVNCHLHFGHLGNFSAYNPEVVRDALTWNQKITNRPTSK